MAVRRRELPIPPSWRPRLVAPGRTIRLRLTLLYGTVFLVSSVALLTVGYLVVRSNLHTHHVTRDALRDLGFRVTSPGRPVDTPSVRLIHAVQQQIVNSALSRLLLEYVSALVLTTVVSVVTGWMLAGRALAPLRKITATAQRVSGENLGERIDLHGPTDELKQLADTFDGMLVRLDGAFASQRHFVANASHELRTPLAIMRTEVDVTLADPDVSAGELRTMGEAILETVDRCERLIASLLLLARSEAATGRGEPVDVAVLAGDCITDMRAHVQEAQVEIHSELDPAWTDGDPGLLERLIANLVDNGLHHNEPGGFLSVSTGVQDGRVVITVANGGPSIDPEDVAGLTEPFRRLRRSESGFGLGLSIVRSIAEAHGGRAILTAPDAGGLVVRIELPRARAMGVGRPSPAEALTES